MLTGNQTIYTVVGVTPAAEIYNRGYEVRMFAFFNKTDADRKIVELKNTSYMGFSSFYVAIETVGNSLNSHSLFR